MKNVLLVLLFATLICLVFSKFTSTLSSSEVTESISDHSYTATVHFKILGIQQESNVTVMCIDPNQTVEFYIPKKTGDQYSISLKKIFSPQELSNFQYHLRPEFIVTWKTGNQKHIDFIR